MAKKSMLMRQRHREAAVKRALLADRERRLRADIRLKAGDLLAARRNLDVADELLGVNREAHQLVSRRVAAGATPPLDENLALVEVNRLEALDDGRPEDEAKGYGIWLAKVVAGRRYGQKADRDGHTNGQGGTDKGPRRSQVEGFKAVGGEVQTDETFDSEIIDRMGGRFYDEVHMVLYLDGFAATTATRAVT